MMNTFTSAKNEEATCVMKVRKVDETSGGRSVAERAGGGADNGPANWSASSAAVESSRARFPATGFFYHVLVVAVSLPETTLGVLVTPLPNGRREANMKLRPRDKELCRIAAAPACRLPCSDPA